MSFSFAGAAMGENQSPPHTHNWRRADRCTGWVPGSPRQVFGRIHHARFFPWRDPHATAKDVYPSPHHLFSCLR